MQANTTSPHPRVSDVASWMVAVFGIVLLVLLLLSFALETRKPAGTSTGGAAAGARIAYFEFGFTADTLWLTSTADPTRRQQAFTAAHAPGFGAVPSLAPNGSAVVYNTLPASTAEPAPDAPADLWYASLTARSEARHVAGDVDLLVAPVWSPDAQRVVFRRSDATSYSLIETPVAGGAERVLVITTSDHALFPVDYTADGSTLFHVAVSNEGTQLFSIDTQTGDWRSVAQLSGGLTRDWTLSPDDTKLAFLALTQTPAGVTSRAYVLDLASAEIEPVTEAGVTAFGPAWDQQGALIVGALTPEGAGSLIKVKDGDTSQLFASSAGFDVPLANLPGGAYLVRAFEGASATAPGRVSLTLIDSNGERHVLNRSDVTFAGWSTR